MYIIVLLYFVLGDEEHVIFSDPLYSSSDLLHFSVSCSRNIFISGSALLCSSILFTARECLLGENLLLYFFTLRMMKGYNAKLSHLTPYICCLFMYVNDDTLYHNGHCEQGRRRP
jgi:hypothetical protein